MNAVKVHRMEMSAEAQVLLQADDVLHHVDIFIEGHGSILAVSQRMQIRIGFEIRNAVLTQTEIDQRNVRKISKLVISVCGYVPIE